MAEWVQLWVVSLKINRNKRSTVFRRCLINYERLLSKAYHNKTSVKDPLTSGRAGERRTQWLIRKHFGVSDQSRQSFPEPILIPFDFRWANNNTGWYIQLGALIKLVHSETVELKAAILIILGRRRRSEYALYSIHWFERMISRRFCYSVTPLYTRTTTSTVTVAVLGEMSNAN